jgi:hypothetical protein
MLGGLFVFDAIATGLPGDGGIVTTGCGHVASGLETE